MTLLSPTHGHDVRPTFRGLGNIMRYGELVREQELRALNDNRQRYNIRFLFIDSPPDGGTDYESPTIKHDSPYMRQYHSKALYLEAPGDTLLNYPRPAVRSGRVLIVRL